MDTTTPILNTGAFWDIYDHMRPGAVRRQALRAHFENHPDGALPVNNKWQASTRDPDIARLMKQGVVVQFRGGGRRQHPQNRSSGKRQSYLKLAA